MYRFIRNIIAVQLVLVATDIYAQTYVGEVDPMLIRLKARVLSAGDSTAVPYANIVNYRNRSGASTNVTGHFTLEMLNVDSLVISAMGYKPLIVKIPQNYSETATLTIFMQPVVYALGEVKVTGDKQHVNMDGVPIGKESPIPVEMRGDAFNEAPPLLAALFNPMSYWQYYLSRREKQKRRAREAMALETLWEMHAENYNKEMVMMLTGLNEQQADDFMIWFNAQNILPYTSTEYEVRSAIRKYFLVYANERNNQ